MFYRYHTVPVRWLSDPYEMPKTSNPNHGSGDRTSAILNITFRYDCKMHYLMYRPPAEHYILKRRLNIKRVPDDPCGEDCFLHVGFLRENLKMLFSKKKKTNMDAEFNGLVDFVKSDEGQGSTNRRGSMSLNRLWSDRCWFDRFWFDRLWSLDP